ncbi:MAG TPA: extracellular solute-binding protein [Candidatus Saccharimonadales bacterium]|nr:extracellular solute-binding protein [Candidatus Saccharimonadales bacterium]
MDENVVFNSTTAESSGNQVSGNVEQPVNRGPQIIDLNQAGTGQAAETMNDQIASEESEVQPEQVPPSEPPPPIHSSFFGGRIFKIIIGLVVLIIVIFLVVLLIPKGKDNKKAKLVWWGLWEDQAVMQPLIADFQKQHPNITVEYVKQDPKQYREKLLTRIKNGTGPDIFRFHNTWVPMISDVLLPLSSDVITPEAFKKDYYPVMQKDLIQNGAIYGVPMGVDTLGLFVNTEIFKAGGKQPPQTWEDFVSEASDLTVKDENGKIKTAGAALGTYGNITHAPDILAMLFLQQGVDLKKFPEQVDKETEALNFYTQFGKGDKNVWDSTLDESILSFARGNLAMYIGFSWDIFRIQALNKDLAFSTHPVPQLVGQRSNLASYWVEGISSKSQNQNAALLFMQYLAKKETAQKFYSSVSKTRAFGEPYARVDLANSLKDNPILFPFVSELETANSSVFASDTNDSEGGINFMSNTYLGDSINAIVNDNSSPQTVIETLDKGIDQVYQKYGIQ